jgi:hypothetical protein
VNVSPAKIGATVMAGGFVLWGLALFVGLPFLYGKKVEALVGQPAETVRRELGPPKAELPDGDGGRLFEYAEGDQGWYLTFDATGKLRGARRRGPAGDAGP